MIQEGGADSARMRWLRKSFVAPLFRAIVALVEAARPQSAALARLPAHHVFLLLVAAGPHPFATASETRSLTGRDPFAKDAVEKWARTIETLLLGPA